MTTLLLLNTVKLRNETSVKFRLISGYSGQHPAAIENISWITQFRDTEQVYNYSAPQFNNFQTAC